MDYCSTVRYTWKAVPAGLPKDWMWGLELGRTQRRLQGCDLLERIAFRAALLGKAQLELVWGSQEIMWGMLKSGGPTDAW